MERSSIVPIVICLVSGCLDVPDFSTGSTTNPENNVQLGRLLSVDDVAVGRSHVCALADGSVYCWGDGSQGQIGDGREQFALRPTKVPLNDQVSAVFAGFDTTCAIAGVELWCWGDNASGKIEPSSDEVVSRPQRVPADGTVVDVAIGNTTICISQEIEATPEIRCFGDTVPFGLTSVTSIAAGDGFACATSGTNDICWGLNSSGQLGAGCFDDSCTEVPFLIPGIPRRVTAGRAHACIVNAENQAYCWGDNQAKQLIDLSDNVLIPTGVAIAVSDIRAAGDSTCAIQIDGRVFCWGEGRWGHDGSGLARSTLRYDNTGPPAYTFVSDERKLAVGDTAVCALDEGELSCWGRDLTKNDASLTAPAVVEIRD